MSLPSGAIWNCRSGFGICFKHTTMFRGTARGRRRGRYLIVSCDSLGEWSTLPGGRFFPRTAGANTSPCSRTSRPRGTRRCSEPTRRPQNERPAGRRGLPSCAYGKIPRHLYASTTRAIATMYAACRMSTFFASRMSQTRLKALTMMPSSFSSTSFFVQKNSDRFCTHSKYDTVTSPPLARMSGITRMPRLCKMSSASGVVGPDVAESLDRDARAFQVQLDLLAGLAGGVHHAPRRRFVPAERAADHERLARDHTRLGEPLVHRDRVHDPRHRLAVRVHVRGRDVLLRADDDRDFGGVPAGHALELPPRHLLRGADHAAFLAPVPAAPDPALPGHPARKGADLVQGDVPVVPDPALERPDRVVVLHAVAGENPHLAVVHLHREVHRELAARVLQDLEEPGVQVQLLAGPVDLLPGDVKGIQRFLHFHHATRLPNFRQMSKVAASRAVRF